MVKRVKNFWVCEECGLKYKEKKWAEKCEAWCRKHKSCNLEITKHAVKERASKVKEGALLGTGIISAFLGILGAFGLCCSPLVIGFFAVFGFSSATFLMTYNKIFLITGVIFLLLGIFYYMKRRKSCNV